jgi:hypothetical protein
VNSSLVCIHIFFARLRPIGGEHMQIGEETNVDSAIREIAALLAAAYKRHVKIPLVHTPPEPLPSTEELANSGETSVHELTLTRRRGSA